MRSARSTIAIVAALVATLLLVAAPAFADELDAAVAAARGSALPINATVEQTAQASAARQASANQIGHASITHLLAVCHEASEVVGHGPNVPSIFLAFQASPEHWRQITMTGWTAMGTGSAIAADGSMYVSIIFCREKAPSPAPVPPPTTTTTAPAPTPSAPIAARVPASSVVEIEPVELVLGPAPWIPVDEWAESCVPAAN